MTLEEKHRKAQLVLRAATLRDLLKLWPMFDLNDIPRTWDAFEQALVLLMRARGRTSGDLARAYLRDYRKEHPGFQIPLAASVDIDKARAGLTVVGPINATKQIQNGRPIEEVTRKTLVMVSGEVTRHVFNAGRQTLFTGFGNAGVGRYARITDSNPCAWCSEQATRTYPITAPFGAHSHCACFPQPI